MGLVQLVLDLLAPAASPAQPLMPVPPQGRSDGEDAPDRKRRPIVLASEPLEYVLVRARRRTIGMLVGPDGLEVRAPRWVSVREIEAALHEKADWIVRKLAESQELKRRRMEQAIEWRDGASFPYLGQPVILRLGPAPVSPSTPAGRHPKFVTETEGQAILYLGLPPHAQEAQVRDTVQSWLMRQARPHFIERLDHFAAVAGVRWTGLALSGARTRWGSASVDGRIRLNWRLMHLRPALIDYVVVHELSHLKVMDHSPSFWDAVGEVMPDYDVRRTELRDHALNTDL
ncbi:MAG: SprT family zinc-dependent metalloprotease [Alphaproteobacteria bacterium]|nr:SprT family zinc-dependent metalloprotease [Alphaproteobacteria bacterium]